MRVVLVLLFVVCVSSRTTKEVESSETDQNYQPMLTAMFDNLKDGLDVMKHTLNKMDLETCQETMWPSGRYGLPMPNSRCPGGISWSTGFNTQITEITTPAANLNPTRALNENEFSPDSFLHGVKNQVSITQGFCMKVDSASGRGSWPKGQYCIYKFISCPSGFQEGSVTWNDEDDQVSPNVNRQSGSLPDGSFLPISTQIEFCCRDDGSVSISINLPVGRPFFFFRRGRLCQQVRGMKVLEESVKWDTDDQTRASTSTGSIPASVVGQTVRLHYCYYRGV